MLRKVLYLVAVLPVTYVIALLSALPAALILPPDILQQSILTVPLFCIGGGLIAGRLIPMALTSAEARDAMQRRRCERFVIWLHLAVCLFLLGGVLSGLLTPRQGVFAAAALILAAHSTGLRWLAGSSVR